MQYQTNVGAAFPALKSQMPDMPHQFPGAANDAYNSLRSGYEANMAMANRDAELEFANKKLLAQRDTALSGLRNLAEAKQNEQSAALQQQGMNLGLVNSILSGLYK